MNIIITGPKHCGKSTLLSKVISNYSGSISGFITEFDSRESDFRSLNLRNIDSTKIKCAVQWNNGYYTIDISTFDIFAPKLIDKSCDLVIFDELGKFELECNNLKLAVEDAFSSCTDVIAILRSDAPGWMGDLKNRSDVTVINLNEENRNDLVFQLSKLISK